MHCSKCNRQLSATAVFCPACGTKVIQQNDVEYTKNISKEENTYMPDTQHNSTPYVAEQTLKYDNAQTFNKMYSNYDNNQQNYGDKSHKETGNESEGNFEAKENESVLNQNKKKKKKILIIVPIVAGVVVLAVIVFVLLNMSSSTGNNGYEDAVALMNSGKYTEAIAEFEKLDGYKDSKNLINECNKALKYENALSLMKSGKYAEAMTIFEELGEYSDSVKKIKECVSAEYRNAEIGDYIKFGSYEQDNDESNGKENVEWLVIDKQEDKVFVISKYALDCVPYNEEEKNITWETCSIRKWLNEEFIGNAFSELERDIIKSTNVINEDGIYNVDGGDDTIDKVFLLSTSESRKYFTSEQERMCNLTAYAVKKMENASGDGNSTCCWWLRSPGKYRNYASIVNDSGSIIEYGDVVYSDMYSVRPALWISLNQ